MSIIYRIWNYLIQLHKKFYINIFIPINIYNQKAYNNDMD